jgi:hypothetical protein
MLILILDQIANGKNRMITTKEKPVYTQSMKDAGELPSVGMECAVLNNRLGHATWEKGEILFIGKFKVVYNSESGNERVGKLKVAYNSESGDERVGNICISGEVDFDVIDIRTPEEKQVDEVVSFMESDSSGCEYKTLAICLQKAGLLAEIIKPLEK